jgi:hypothetical protein
MNAGLANRVPSRYLNGMKKPKKTIKTEMDRKLTDDLTAAVSAWATLALAQLDAERLKIVETVYADPNADLRVVVRLKQGSLILDATVERPGEPGKRMELFREDVHPLRPQTGFATPDNDTKQ